MSETIAKNANYIDSAIKETIRNFEVNDQRYRASKKETVFKLRDLLILKGMEHSKISSEIIKLTKGKIDDQYVRELLGPQFKNQSFSNKTETLEARLTEPKVLNEMSKTELREYTVDLERKRKAAETEMQARKMAPEVDESAAGLPNKSVTGTPLHDEQITKPKYTLDEDQKEFQDIVDRAAAVLEQRIKFIREEFIPNLKIESEQEARKLAEAFMWNADIYKPACDEKYRLSLIDWAKIISLYQVHGSSAASKLFKKPIADIKEIDPKTLPAGFVNTILALKYDEATGNTYYISPTKEHIDSKINFVLELFTQFINRVKPVATLMEMIESEVRLRNFRAEVLSEKLSDSK